MIAYFDTSAFVPLLVAEPSSAACRRLWEDADEVVASQLAFVETAAALAAAARQGRLTKKAHAGARVLLERVWLELDVVQVDDALMRAGAEFAERFALRGYDAVQCASAAQLDDSDLVAASGDVALLRAWGELGISIFDPNRQPD